MSRDFTVYGVKKYRKTVKNTVERRKKCGSSVGNDRFIVELSGCREEVHENFVDPRKRTFEDMIS